MARKTTPRPTDGELAILRVLWHLGSGTVREVQEELEKTQPTGYTTVLKLLQIMSDKGLVTRDESRRAHVYRAAEQRQQVQRGLLGDLMDRVFEGSAAQLVQQALASRPASSEELDEIRKILDDMETPSDDSPHA